jgi:hypothetical protein
MTMNRFTRCVYVLAIVTNLVAAASDVSRGRGWLIALHLGLAVGMAWMYRHNERRIRRARNAARLAQLLLDSLDATPPEGVKVVRADGAVIPGELVYRGRDEDGQHLWELAGMILRPGDRLYADVMPGHTGIGFQAEE